MFKLSASAVKRLGHLRFSSSVPSAKLFPEKRAAGPTDKERPSAAVEGKSSGLVSAAFAALNTTAGESDIFTKSTLDVKSTLSSQLETRKLIDERIAAASNVKSLLQLGNYSSLSRKQSLKIVSTLADWSASGKVILSEFESDPRFLKLCRVLGRQRTSSQATSKTSSSQDLETVLEITGDDEAAKLISSLSLPQMIKVMSTLAQKKRRSTPLLRVLAYNITRHSDSLDLKRAADLLYAMASLNFPDDVLLDRVCSDIQEKLSQNENKSAVVGSIATSLRLLRYRDSSTLEALAEWASTHPEVCQPQHSAALLLALASLDYCPSSPLQQVVQNEVGRAALWLECVWALAVLRQVSTRQLASVLDSEFLLSLQVGDEIPISLRRKLSQLVGYARLCMPDYTAELPSLPAVPLSYSRDKQVLVAALHDALRSLLASADSLRVHCDSGMGFLYDAECLLDSNCTPYSVNLQLNDSKKGLLKIAVLALGYHDTCREGGHPLGCMTLYSNLLRAQGYRVVLVPHTEFSVQDKLVKRVQYLENKFKDVVKSSPPLFPTTPL